MSNATVLLKYVKLCCLQATIRAHACWFNIKCRLKNILGDTKMTNLTSEQEGAYNNMMRDLTKVNSKYKSVSI